MNHTTLTVAVLLLAPLAALHATDEPRRIVLGQAKAILAAKTRHGRSVCGVGIYDAATGRAVVKVFLADKLLCQAPVLKGKDGFRNINANHEGATDKLVLRMFIEDTGDGINGDNVDLVDAGFLVQQ